MNSCPKFLYGSVVRDAFQRAGIVLVLLAAALTGPAAGVPARVSLERLFHHCATNGQFNGVCLVAEQGRVIFRQAYGQRELETRQPNRVRTPFELASVSKPITASAVLLLVGEGRLQLTNEVARFFPGWPYPGVTVYHLLTHTAGLPDYPPLFAADWERSRTARNADLLQRLCERKPPAQFPPGVAWRYSNTGYALLALLVERVSGQSYEAFLQERLFAPSRMRHAGVVGPKTAGLGKGYVLTPRGYQAWWMDRHLDGIVGDGGVYATADDLHAFARAFFSGRLLGKLTRSALTPVRLPGGGFQYQGVGGGLGWQLKFEGDSDQPVAAFHTGNYGGYRALLWHDLRADRTCVLFDNLCHNLDDIATAVRAIWEGQPWELPRKSIQETLIIDLQKEGVVAAIRNYRVLKATRPQDFLFNERELNTAGYLLLRGQAVEDAVKVFALNTEEYPGSFNAFDSLAEAFVAKGDWAEAVRCYERAVQLNPNFTEGKAALQRLRERLNSGTPTR